MFYTILTYLFAGLLHRPACLHPLHPRLRLLRGELRVRQRPPASLHPWPPAAPLQHARHHHLHLCPHILPPGIVWPPKGVIQIIITVFHSLAVRKQLASSK